jgi:exodeoxyribonuclease VII small subunit
MMMQVSSNNLQSLSYEQAYAELEEIVYSLEANQKTLEESIALFERGQALAKYCATLLEQAELKVQQLSGQNPAAGLSDEEDL